MKGIIKIYANSIDKNQTEFTFDMNIKEVTLADKFSIIEALMDALNMNEIEKRIYFLGSALGGIGKTEEKSRFDYDSQDAEENRKRYESLVSEE